VRKNWRNANGDPVKNMDLWQRILDVCKIHKVEWQWIRSHIGIPLNERADKLATAARNEGMAAMSQGGAGQGRKPKASAAS